MADEAPSSERPALSVVVVASGHEPDLSSMLWSVLGQDDVDLEVLLTVPRGSARVAARRLAREDSRLRVLSGDRRTGSDFAAGLGMRTARGEFVAFAPADGLVAAGAYRELLGLLRSSGSDFATGIAEEFGGKGRPRVGGTDGPEFALTVSRAELATSPRLVLDLLPWNKVFRRRFLESVPMADTPLVAAAAYAMASSVDVLAQTVTFVRHEAIGEIAAEEQVRVWVSSTDEAFTLLAGAPEAAQAAFVNQVLAQQLEQFLPALGAVTNETRRACVRLVRRLAPTVTPADLARLKVRMRWAVALLWLGRTDLLQPLAGGPPGTTQAPEGGVRPLPANLAAVLGLAGDPWDVAFRRRFLESSSLGPVQQRTGDAAAPEISVVIPTQNVEGYLDDLLVSVRAASGVLLEIIVVDDDSTDCTWQVAQRHAEEDSRLRLERSPGKGGGAARNHGVSIAKGEYLAFADGDDLVPPHAYARMLTAARRTGADVVSGSYLKFGDGWAWDGGEMFGYDVELDGITLADHPRLAVHRACWNRLIRRDHWLACATPFPSVPRANDIVPMTRVLVAARRMSVVPDVVYHYRTRPGSMTAGRGGPSATRSYLAQETAAAAMIAEVGLPHLAAEYWEMVLPHDCWHHVRAYLSSASASGFSDQDQVVRAVSNLLEAAPPQAGSFMTLAQRSVFALVRIGDLGSAAQLAQVVTRDGDFGRISVLGLSKITGVIEAGLRSGLLTTDDLGRLFWRLVVRGLGSEALDGETGEGVCRLLRMLNLEYGVKLHCLPGSQEERLVAAMRTGSVATVNQEMTPREPLTADLHSGLFGTWLNGSRDTPAPQRGWIMARGPNGRAMSLPLGRVRPVTGGGWRAALRPHALTGSGEWKLSLVGQDPLGHVIDRITVREKRSGPATALSRFSVRTRRPDTIVLRRGVASRAWSRSLGVARRVFKAVLSPQQ